MILSPASPITFLEPASRAPDTLWLAEARGSSGSAVCAGTDTAILSVRPADTPARATAWLEASWDVHVHHDAAPIRDTVDALTAYFDGEPGPIHAVVLPVAGTPFMRLVHEHLARIPYGSCVTYGELAALIGHPGAARAVGTACGRNHAAIIVPCHRVVATGGLGGYGPGLAVKRALLDLEGHMRDRTP